MGDEDHPSLQFLYCDENLSKKRPYRQWLYDRVVGTSKYGTSRPPCPACWVPPPILCCPTILEENQLCISVGKIGSMKFATNETARFRLLSVGILVNIVGFLCTLYACRALTMDFYTLQSSSFSSATIIEQNGLLPNKKIDVGLRAAAFESQNDSKLLVSFNQLCDLPHNIGFAELVDDNKCAGCAMVSSDMVKSVVVACISFLPTFITDVLRMYSNYDVNCQKAIATIVSLISFIASITTLLYYNQSCFASFYEGYLYVTADGTVVMDYGENGDDDNAIKYILDISWGIGPGLICLYAGTVLKGMDIIFHCLIPTPSITRNYSEQYNYEKLYGNVDRSSSCTNCSNTYTTSASPTLPKQQQLANEEQNEFHDEYVQI